MVAFPGHFFKHAASLDIVISQKAYNIGADRSARMRRLVCANAQAGLRLCCSQIPEGKFSYVKAHVIKDGQPRENPLDCITQLLAHFRLYQEVPLVSMQWYMDSQ